MLAEVDGTGSLIRSYAIGHDMLAQYEADTPAEGTYILADGHGSTRQLTDASAAVTAVYGYDAYGLSLSNDPDATQSTSLQFSGEQTDALTGLQYLRARYYDATTGRFNRRDPFAGNHRDPQSLHKYMYCHGDPVNNVDPTGMFLLDILGSSFMQGLRRGMTAQVGKSIITQTAMLAFAVTTFAVAYNTMFCAPSVASFMDASGVPIILYEPRARDIAGVLTRVAEKGRKLTHVFFRGHGQTTFLVLGGDTVIDKNGNSVSLMGQGIDYDIGAALDAVLAPGATVVLGGCENGRGEGSLAELFSVVLPGRYIHGGLGRHSGKSPWGDGGVARMAVFQDGKRLYKEWSVYGPLSA